MSVPPFERRRVAEEVDGLVACERVEKARPKRVTTEPRATVPTGHGGLQVVARAVGNSGVSAAKFALWNAHDDAVSCVARQRPVRTAGWFHPQDPCRSHPWATFRRRTNRVPAGPDKSNYRCRSSGALRCSRPVLTGRPLVSMLSRLPVRQPDLDPSIARVRRRIAPLVQRLVVAEPGRRQPIRRQPVLV